MATNIKMAIDELHNAFYKFNELLYDNKLPEQAILIQNRGNKKNVLGWCSTREIWVNDADKEMKYEINIVAESLDRTLLQIMCTLLHEMAHLYNLVNGIKDVTRNGTYHNKKFKETAEAHGLIIEHDTKIGWSPSTLQDKTKELIESLGFNEGAFNLVRVDLKAGGKSSSKSSVRKYVCPICGTIIRSSKEVKVICADCEVLFVKDESEDMDKAS